MDFVTTRLQMENWNVFFLSLTMKNARKFGKLAKFFLAVREPRNKLGKMTKKVVGNSEIFPRKCRKYFVVREPRQNFVKWPASRKRLRTADLRLVNNSTST